MNSIAEVSATIREAWSKSGLKQTELRAAAGISRQTLANVLSGQEDFKVSTLLALSDRLGLELVLLPMAAAERRQAQVVESLVDRARRGLAERLS